jgi:DNA-binding HxlR family transcriptional regulator
MLTDSLRGLERDGFVERSVWGSESRSSRVAVLMDESAAAVASFQVV